MAATEILAYIGIVGSVVGILGGGGFLGWWWRKQPERELRQNRSAAVADAILGEEAIRDRSGEVIQPARPGLVHRVGTVEDAVIEFRHAIGLLTETLKRIDTIDARLQVLEHATVEKIVTRAESAAMWKVLSERDVLDEDEQGGA